MDDGVVEKIKDVFSVNENVIEGATTMVYLIKTGNSTWKDAYKKLKEAKPNAFPPRLYLISVKPFLSPSE